MKQDKLIEAYDKSTQAMGLVQICGHHAKNGEMKAWQAFELLKTLHTIIGESSLLLAELLDEREERKEQRKTKGTQ